MEEKIKIEIPIIDLSPWFHPEQFDDSSRLSVSKEWDKTFQEYGCAIIIGHGILEENFNHLNVQMDIFFSQTLSQKMIHNKGPYGNPSGGYTPAGGESVSHSLDGKSSILPDNVESFVLLPQSLETIDINSFPMLNSFKNYMKSVEEILHKLHEISTLALNINEKDYFRPYYDPNHSQPKGKTFPGYALRLAYYPQQINKNTGYKIESESPENEKQFRYGPHTDYLGFTILRADTNDWEEYEIETEEQGKKTITTGGLQIYHNKSGRWINVKIPYHLLGTALVVNAGDLFQRWTNDRWVSPIHRVLNPSTHATESNKPRKSVVFFTGPMEDTVISVIPGITESPRYEPVLCKDYFLSKISPTSL